MLIIFRQPKCHSSHQYWRNAKTAARQSTKPRRDWLGVLNGIIFASNAVSYLSELSITIIYMSMAAIHKKCMRTSYINH